MTISNGYNMDKVYAAFLGRLGWTQPTVSGVPALTTQNTTSISSRYYEDFHEGCRLRLLMDAQEDANITADAFNALLAKMDQAVTTRVLNAVFCKPQLVEHTLNYERISNLRNIVIPNQGNFCGYRIKLGEGNYATVLNNLGFFFNAAATFNIYLFNDLTLAPLQTQSVTTVANTQTVVAVNWLMNYISDNKGGLFYVGYFQNDLPPGVNALDEQLNLWADSKLFGAYPFQSPQVPGQLDFNRINPSVVFRSYGFNLEVSTYNDFTQAIIENASLFDEVRGLAMATKVLEQIRWSYRTNSEQRISSESMGKDINQDVNVGPSGVQQPFIAGLKEQVKRELQRLYMTFFPKEVARSVGIGADYDREAFAYDTFDIKNLPPRERFF